MFFVNPLINAAPLVTTGLDVLATQHPEMVRGKNIALLTSKTAYDKNLNHSIDRLARATTIEIIFTSDKGFRESIPLRDQKGIRDALTNALIYQINDPLARPPSEILNNVELLVIDVQDIGIRYFKYITLLAQFLDLANEVDLPVVLLDRPNPINCTKVAGPVLEVSFRSRFGVYPVPLIYGMTIGELALYFNKVYGLGADLTVVGMEGYSRDMSYEETGLCWLPPSDHIPEPDSPYYYATTGFLGELGVFSTGVGTTRPFHYILAPWIDGELLAKKLQKHKLPGVQFIPTKLKPYYGLYSGKETSGIELFITDKISYEPFLTGMGILKALWELYPERVPLRNPAAAEAIDTLLGSSTIRNKILAGEPLMMIYSSLKPDLAQYLKKRREFIIYHE